MSEGFEGLLCDDCKKNIVLQTSKLKLVDKFHPKRVARKSVHWICNSCREKIASRLRSGRK